MHWPHHPDDEPSPRFGGWADDFNTFDEACRFYGADNPTAEDIQAEMEVRFEEHAIEDQDAMEARGGPSFRPIHPDDVIPF